MTERRTESVSYFDYNLPEELIAQTPLAERSSSRLMVINRATEEIRHNYFHNIISYLNPGDTLVLNNTKVLPARLYGQKEDTNAKIEILLLKELSENSWAVLAKPAKRLKIGNKITFGDGLLRGEVTAVHPEGERIIKFTYEGIFLEILEKLGKMPLPPYIKQELSEQNRYQTVYAKYQGSAAAPTAGLHFTEDLLRQIADIGVNIAYLTLHVGLGTFRPVNVEDIKNHRMHAEYYQITEETANLINETKAKGHRVIAVGTTSVRTLETIAKNNNGHIVQAEGWTDIFIYPGFKFCVTDALITNFHLPKSTLLMLVSAFATRDLMMKAYNEAIEHKYRFFSFGDAMLIL